MLSSMGVEVVDERPYALEGLERESMIYEFGLRYGEQLPQRLARAVPGRAAGRVGRLQRERRLQRAGARRRADLAAGDRAARVREVHAPGQQPVRAGLHRGRAARERRHHPAAWSPSSRRGSTPSVDRPARRGATEAEEEIERRILAASTTWPASTTTGSCAPTSPTSRRRCAPTTSSAGPTRRAGGPHTYMSFKLEPTAIPDLPRAAAQVRDLRLLTAGRGRAPAVRCRRARRPALVGPARGLPHRGARPGQGADGEEHRDRAGRREGRLLLQAAARPGRPRRVAGRGRRLLQDVHLRAARHHRQPGRRRDGAARATSFATTATTPTWWSRPTRAPRRSPTSPTASRRTTASGSATRSPAVARSATTTRRWASPPAARGSRCSGTSASAGIDCQTEEFTASASAT